MTTVLPFFRFEEPWSAPTCLWAFWPLVLDCHKATVLAHLTLRIAASALSAAPSRRLCRPCKILPWETDVQHCVLVTVLDCKRGFVSPDSTTFNSPQGN